MGKSSSPSSMLLIRHIFSIIKISYFHSQAKHLCDPSTRSSRGRVPKGFEGVSERCEFSV